MSSYRYLIFIFLLFLLTGCKEKLTYSYLTQHPAVLKKAVVRCQSMNQSSNRTGQCAIVMQAAADIMALLSEQQVDPEKFGQRVMDAEIACAKAESTTREPCVQVKILLAVIGSHSPE